ncbi:CoA ester lyase [Pelomonas sp. KK5]|uniref:HpcH/HpaI aldolase/citrate lyase family protein n=1 Tax=Pelomonas sp. KK5 TaxID=1855730 RepID=UPI00097CAB1D|nr:aldolase/citrate lyase family protein [Pelomonas sp. KK5]
MHPNQALFEEGDAATLLPVVDHYCGVEARMVKSLELQAAKGPVFDITLDCEDGAPIGGEAEHVQLVLAQLHSANNRHGRVGARVHPFDHASFEADVDELVRRGGEQLAYLMVPKPRGLADVEQACNFIDEAIKRHGIRKPLPVHVLIETHGALQEVFAIAAHPRIESLSFGLMDFVSAHRGAIPRTGMSAQGQFTHPLVVRAKLEIAAASHAHAKTPSHCVVTEFKSASAIQAAATRAAREFGYTRMWSIHPNQIQPIIDAFAPSVAEIDEAIEIIQAAQAAQWAPIQHRDTLHDRASYRYFWQLIERAHRTGQPLPAEVLQAWFAA